MKKLLYGLSAMALLSGCYPEQPTYIDEFDLVYTNYAPDFNFFNQTTYAVPDSVIKVTGGLLEGGDIEMVKAIYGDRIVARLRDNMNEKGWVEVDPGNDPDVVLLPAVFTSTTVNYYYPWYSWGWYYPGYGPGWGWYYPGYYPPVVSTYSTGTLLVQMTYPDGRGENDYVPVEWVLIVDGLMEGSSNGLLERIDFNINQGFEQSPYLQQ